MISFGKFLSVVGVSGLVLAGTPASAQSPSEAPAAGTPAVEAVAPPVSKSGKRLDEVFNSIQQSTQGEPIDVPWMPLLLGGMSIALGTMAIKQWNRHQARPKVRSQHDHRKLLKQVARSAGLSQRQLKTIAPLSAANGLSSPLVAVICPSAIKSLAQNVKTIEQQEALQALAKGLLKRQPKAAQDVFSAH